jgi:hypothetical protein
MSHFTMSRVAQSGSDTLFSDIAGSPAEHFRIYFFGAVLGLIEHVSTRFGSFDEAMKRFPFLAGYHNEPAERLDGRLSDELVSHLAERLQRWSLVQILSTEMPRQDWPLQIPTLQWDALRTGECSLTPDWLRYRPPSQLQPLSRLVAAEELRRAIRALPRILHAGEAHAIVVRGPRHNGRHATLGAVAHEMGCGLIELLGLNKPDDERWRQAAALALLLHALPVVSFEHAPGETMSLPEMLPPSIPLGIVVGSQGGLSGSLSGEAVTLTVAIPGIEARCEHWRRCLACAEQDAAAELSERFRLSGLDRDPGWDPAADRLIAFHYE